MPRIETRKTSLIRQGIGCERARLAASATNGKPTRGKLRRAFGISPPQRYGAPIMAQGLPFPSLLVVAGGGFGAWLRYMVGRASVLLLGAAPVLPWATLFCNIGGSFAMGLLVGWLARAGGIASLGSEGTRLLLGVGVLGGFTTFSSFSLEFALLVERGQIGTAALYVAVSLAAGFAGLFAGLMLMRSLLMQGSA
jgi:CrcB protein